MGGSGAYLFVSYYYNEYSKLLAGIVRTFRQSETDLRDEIANRTPIWCHIEINDDVSRVTIAETDYPDIKNSAGNTSTIYINKKG